MCGEMQDAGVGQAFRSCCAAEALDRMLGRPRTEVDLVDVAGEVARIMMVMPSAGGANVCKLCPATVS